MATKRMHSSKQTIPTDEVFGLLAASERRRVLQYLADSDGSATIDELARIVDGEQATPTESGTDHERRKIELYHVHLPMLSEAGLVDLDRRHGSVRYYPDERVECLLEETSF